MRSVSSLVIAFAALFAPVSVSAADDPPAPPADVAKRVKLERIARSKGKPLYLTHAPGDTSGRLFVVEQVGTIRILRDGKLGETPFLDISDRVSRASEQGLLGLAFHPDYAKNRRFYIHYTNRDGDTRVVERKVSSSDPERVDPSHEREVLAVDQPWSNHNGGHLLFGPDGKLWIGLGDGGSAGDPQGNGQDPDTLLGKMLRLDVDKAGAKPEIVQLGLRNPWRYAFDPKTGDLYIADVGQDKWEEVDVVAAGKLEGVNFGWNVAEGNHCYRTRRCDLTKYTAPVVEYDHTEGCSITGGFVYRGKALPELDGIYFYADYCTGLVRGFRWKDGAVSDHWDWKQALDPDFKLATISSFGQDADGELYLLSLDGAIWKLGRKGR